MMNVIASRRSPFSPTSSSLAMVVRFAHHPALFSRLFLLFLGVAQAYAQHQDRLILREGLLVCLLSGRPCRAGRATTMVAATGVVHGTGSGVRGTTILTAFTDNAALTYLGSLVEGLSDAFKYALVAGAVTGGD